MFTGVWQLFIDNMLQGCDYLLEQHKGMHWALHLQLVPIYRVRVVKTLGVVNEFTSVLIC